MGEAVAAGRSDSGGRRLLVTRPAAQAAAWVVQLRALGVDACALPLIDIAPPADPHPVRSEWRRLDRRELVVFVSPNAVERFFAERPAGIRWPATPTVAVPGPGSRSALVERGVAAGAVVEPDPRSAQFDSQALWERLRTRSWHGASVLIVRGEGGRDWLAERLVESGAHVDFVSAYRRLPAGFDAAGERRLHAALEFPQRHAWLFSSSEAIDRLLETRIVSEPTARRQLGEATAIATHPRIVARAHEAGFGRVVASHPTPPGVVACLQSLAAEDPIQ